MPADDDVGRPVGAEQEEARALGAQSERRNQVDRRRIAPLEVVEPENQRALRGERLDGVAHLAQHALAIRAGDAREKPFALRLREERRHLREPRRGVATEHVEHPIPAGTAAHRRQRLQHRKVRLPGSVVLDALPAGDAKLVAGRGGGEEMAGQRGLADSRLAGEEHDLPRPRERRVEPRRRAARARCGARRRSNRRGRSPTTKRWPRIRPRSAPRSGSRDGRPSRCSAAPPRRRREAYAPPARIPSPAGRSRDCRPRRHARGRRPSRAAPHFPRGAARRRASSDGSRARSPRSRAARSRRRDGRGRRRCRGPEWACRVAIAVSDASIVTTTRPAIPP